MKKVALFVLLLICFQSGHSIGASQRAAIQRIFDYLVANNLFNGAALAANGGSVVCEGGLYSTVEDLLKWHNACAGVVARVLLPVLRI